ncbi:DUF4097 family beta strand repeat-containing protein [Alkaliflexus imshenetskii]|uniref:hypothetical protein n=1 Tax=Alkaliflexus imshenetskii TaxID=286730 RepID=UPI00047E7163|nr:hypothetical protein [Alkaliflexus imshenetskii]
MRFKTLEKHLLTVGLFFLSVMATGQEQEQERDLTRFHKSQNDAFASDNIKQLTISNRHGQIFFTGWNRDSVLINVSIWTEAPFQSLASDVHDQIAIASQRTSQGLSYQTVFRENFFSSYSFGIDYHIYAPHHLLLDLKNRFGDIHLDHLSGDIKINMEYGNLIIVNQPDKIKQANISLLNGNLTAENIQSAKITHHNGQLRLNEVDHLELNSDFSEIGIRKVREMNVDAKTGKIQIGEAHIVNLNSTHSTVAIQTLTGRGFFEMTHGALNIRSIVRGLDELTVSSDNAPLHIELDKNVPYTLHGQLENGTFSHSDAEDIRILKEENMTSFSGQSAHATNAPTTIILFGKSCTINFMVR